MDRAVYKRVENSWWINQPWICSRTLCSIYYFILFYFCFLGLHLWHMEVPRLGVESEQQLPAYTTAIATLDPSRICDLHHSSQQHRFLNPLSRAKDWTHVHMDTSRVCFCWSTTGTPILWFIISIIGVSIVAQWLKNLTSIHPWGSGFDPWPHSVG